MQPTIHHLDVTGHLDHAPLDVPSLLVLQLFNKGSLQLPTYRRTDRYLIRLHRHVLIGNFPLTLQYSLVCVLVRATELLRHRE